MFTGLIEEVGSVRAIIPNAKGARLQINAKQVIKEALIGDSIAVNGCCLTVVELDSDHWSADVVSETMDRTCFRNLKPLDRVNLETPLKFNGRLGGHLVQGHIDGIGKISAKSPLLDGSTLVTIESQPAILRYIVEKGSIAVDGVSLTVASVNDNGFTFAMIPHTEKMTNLGWKQIGSSVNLEVDLIAKYVEKFTR